jgi:AraC family transcriptional regulator
MPDFKLIDVAEEPYLFVERSTTMDPLEISQAMGSAFGEVWAFMEEHGVAPAGGALSVYYDYSEGRMDFRAGFTIRREDMAAADETVKADVTPAGKVLHFTHVGPYATLRDDYDAMMRHMKAEGLVYAPPTWEIYMNSPDTVPPEKLVTECYQALAR